MPGLFEFDGKDYEGWNSGANLFSIFRQDQTQKKPVLIECRFGELGFEELAMLDTGAEWSVLNQDTIEIIGLSTDPQLKEITCSTRLGDIKGYLTKLNVVFVSKPAWGADLAAEATFFVTDEWTGPNVIGYRNLLEHMKIALQPSPKDDNNIFFFAKSA